MFVRKDKYNKLLNDYKQLEYDSRNNYYQMASAVVERVMNCGINWYDYEKLDRGARKEYCAEAKRLLDSDVLQNEVKRIISDLVEHIAKKSANHEETNSLRMTINGLELLRERLESINDDEKKVTYDNIHDVI